MSSQSTLQSSFKSPTGHPAAIELAKGMIITALSNMAFIELSVFCLLPDLSATVYKKIPQSLEQLYYFTPTTGNVKDFLHICFDYS
jgi:hypothetical protein